MRRPRFLAVLTSIVLASAALAVDLAGVETSAASLDPQSADGYGFVRNVLPPGQSGTVTAVDLAQVLLGDPVNRVAVDGKNAPRDFANQLEMYDAINRLSPAQLRTADLTQFYKAETFDVPAGDVLEVRTPKPGVTITRDRFGVPHIKGATYDDVAWGAGYAGTKDRMFLQDVLRHAGAARSSEFLGATPANIAMDQSVLRSSYYTEDEAQAQLTSAASRLGPEGAKLLSAAQSYVAGINAAQDAMCSGGLPVGVGCPAEYAALGRTPQPWKTSDVVYVSGLVGGIFGKGGGAEYGNALWLARLQRKFGDQLGRQVYEDLRGRDDPEAPTTTSDRWSYGGGPIDASLPGVALPDLEGAQAPGTGAPLTSGAALPALDNILTGHLSPAGGVVDTPRGRIDFSLASRGMSNAALVDAAHSANGHPVAVFGPQTGYYTPQMWTEEVLDGPGVKARGVAFAGTNFVVQIGRGVDYAWSATSAGFDNVDTVVERLCEPGGARPTVGSEYYLRDGVCVPMDKRTHTQIVLPTITAPGLPQRLDFLVLRTHHGIVQLRTTVNGEPVAIVHQRSTYYREADSVVGFARVDDPGFVTDAASFQHAMDGIDLTFNWHYVDNRDIAYFGSGKLPIRSPDVHADLPRWGDTRYDWQGFLGFQDHLHQINPPSGYLVSWNNKSGLGPVSGDDAWGYGPVHRSQAISSRVQPLLATGDVTLGALTAAVQDAAVADTRAATTLPYVLDVIGDDPAIRDAVTLLRSWLADGALREDRARTGAYSHQAAIAVFDEWWESAPRAGAPRGADALSKDVLRGGLGALVDQLPQDLDNHPRSGHGSSWNGVAWYGYVNKDLRQLLGMPVLGAWSRSYCGDGSLDACRVQLRASLSAAVNRVLSAQGAATVDAVRYDKQQDDIRSATAGVVGVRPIDWQNRSTFQQVVQFTGHRAR